MRGRIVKIHSDKYHVDFGGETRCLRARGVLKIRGGGICAGDFVETLNESIVKVLPRKNFFIRPSIANIDCVCLVLASEPKPDFLMLDKLISYAACQGVEVIIAVNKSDVTDELYIYIENNYSGIGIDILSVSAKDGSGIGVLKERFENKLTCFAGQSAVGKTSIINAITGLALKVGDLSEKTGRGKHTTTVTEIIAAERFSIVDTPGFSSFFCDIGEEELKDCYGEYVSLADGCKYRSCRHLEEPGCAVKEAVEKGELSEERYGRYRLIYEEIKNNRRLKDGY